MKKIVKVFNTCLLLVFAFILFNSFSVSAKSSSNSVFEVEVGEDTLPIYYSLEDDSGVIKEKVQFSVKLKGLSKESKSYRWEHFLCYKIVGKEEVCEIDITGSDQESNPQSILSNQEYSYSFYDEDMGYYSEGMIFEYIRFSNKFVCLEEGNNEEIILQDIEFLENEIKYDYSFKVDVKSTLNNGKKYVDNYFSNSSGDRKVYVSAYLINNIGSNLKLESAPIFTLTNEVCVDDSICEENVIETVTSSGVEINMNPYMGNLTFYYSMSNLIYGDNNVINHEFARYKSTLKCIDRCNDRIPLEVVLLDEVFYFDNEKPVVDEGNTVIASVDDYVKSVEIKISVSDSKSGLDPDKLIYQIIRPYSSYCSWGSTTNYNYQNGVSFVLGKELADGPYCMKYYAYDNNGNYLESDYYIFYFDNNGPVMTISSEGYVANNYYNEVKLDVSFSDRYSGIDKIYYLWSSSVVLENDYLSVKSMGKEYDNNGTFISNDVKKEGTYYLYFLSFDNLGNYKFYDGGNYNFDFTPLIKEDIVVNKTNMDGYSNNGVIKVNIGEMEYYEEFKCGFFSSGESVTIEELTLTCKNNENIVLPSDAEGEYSLWVYVHDRASNYSLIEVSRDLKIDFKGPSISYSVLKNDDIYYLTNEITLNVSDLSGVNDASLKYGWFLASKNDVMSNDLSLSFVNGSVIEYPRGYYGEYKLYVSALDNLGNEKFIGLDKIFKIDTDIIRISLVGKEKVTIIRGEKYVDEGAKAYKGDVSSGGRVSEIRVEGEVNNKKTGVYYITYSSGEGDLLVSVTRKIVVKNDIPFITVTGSLFVLGIFTLVIRLFMRKKQEGE